MKKIMLLCVLFSLFLFGCGTENSGTLTVSAPAASGDKVTATATYTPASGSALPGQMINFRWYTVGVATKTQSAEIASSGKTDSSGVAFSQLTLPAVRTESFVVYVIASTGEIINSEGWQSVIVAP